MDLLSQPGGNSAPNKGILKQANYCFGEIPLRVWESQAMVGFGTLFVYWLFALFNLQ